VSATNGSRVHEVADGSVDGPVPWIDESGILRVGRRWAPLSDSEWELLAPLVARFGKTVSRADLVASASTGKPIPAAALNVRITRIRHRLEPLGLRLINVRKRGYILDRAHDLVPGQQVYESDT
jgi:DNA-binding winged helix-turn-helix (wHTH) protein